MAQTKLFNLLALASVAVLTLSFGSTPVNALATDGHVARQGPHAHEAIARKKRGSNNLNKRCKQRPTSTTTPDATPTPTDTPTPTTDAPTMTSTPYTPPASSSTSTSAAPAATGGTGAGKWGLGWPMGDDPALSNFLLPDVKYLYSWNPQLPTDLKGLIGIPMLWGYKSIDDFQRLVVQGYATHVLGMNEPNEPSQANMTPEEGVALWRQYINPLKDQGYYLISPACTNDDAGIQWMKDFFSQCPDCHVDAVAFHYYSTSDTAFADYATQLHNLFGRPIWCTEFADQNYSTQGGPQADESEVWGFAGTIKSFIDNTPWMEAAFPFGVMGQMQGVNELNQLYDSSSEYPTSLGYYYFGANN